MAAADLSGTRGWLLVALVAVTLLVVPAVVWYLTLGLQADYGIYVALAMLPGLLFGALGIWTAVRHRPSA